MIPAEISTQAIQRDGAVVIALSQRFEQDHRSREQLLSDVTILLHADERCFVFDIREFAYLENGVSLLVRCSARIREADGTMVVVARGKPLELLHFTHLSKVFKVFDDVESAVNACRA